MASKNQDFTNRLILIIEEMGLDNRKFAEKAGLEYSTLMTYLNKKNIGRVPEWDQLVKISHATNKPIDWFLTGKISETNFITTLPEEIKNFCLILKEILESGNKIAITTLISNVIAFKDFVKKDKRIDDLERKITYLEKILESDKNIDISSINQC